MDFLEQLTADDKAVVRQLISDERERMGKRQIGDRYAEARYRELERILARLDGSQP